MSGRRRLPNHTPDRIVSTVSSVAPAPPGASARAAAASAFCNALRVAPVKRADEVLAGGAADAGAVATGSAAATAGAGLAAAGEAFGADLGLSVGLAVGVGLGLGLGCTERGLVCVVLTLAGASALGSII